MGSQEMNLGTQSVAQEHGTPQQVQQISSTAVHLFRVREEWRKLSAGLSLPR